MQIFAPDEAQLLYREGTKWAKGHLYALIGHLSCHIWALIATAELGNCPREPFSLPLKGHSQGRWIQGAGGACSPQNFHTQKVPFFLSKKCNFKVKHAPSSVRKRTDFLNIFVPKCFVLFAHYGAQLFREGTKLAKGHLYALMRHLALH